MKLTSFNAALHGPLFFKWFESGEYPIFFRALDGFYTPELFSQLPTLMQAFIYVIEIEGKPIGAAIIHDWNRTSRACSIGVMIGKEHQDKKLCEAALYKLIMYLFDERNIQKVSVEFNKEDSKLIHLIEKWGFKKEAELEREAFVNGKFLTMVRYAYFSEMPRSL